MNYEEDHSETVSHLGLFEVSGATRLLVSPGVNCRLFYPNDRAFVEFFFTTITLVTSGQHVSRSFLECVSAKVVRASDCETFYPASQMRVIM